MRVRRFVAALLVLFALGLFATPALGATITYPSTVVYSDQPTFKIAGLKAKTDYIVVIFDRFGQPVAGIPFTSGSDGTYSIPQFGPDQTQDLPGTYMFAVVSAADNVLVASTTTVLSGTNTWFLDKRLGS